MHMTEVQRQSIASARIAVKYTRQYVADGLEAISKPEPQYMDALRAFTDAARGIDEAKRQVMRAWSHGDE